MYENYGLLAVKDTESEDLNRYGVDVKVKVLH
jgi:hypothetical protein